MTAPPLSAATAVDAFIARLEAKDLEGACALVTDDLVYDNVPMGVNHGPSGLRAFLEPMVSGVDEIEFRTLRQVCEGSTVLNERVDRFRVGERWLELPVAGVFEVTPEGLISLWRDYFDLGTLNDQMAALAG